MAILDIFVSFFCRKFTNRLRNMFPFAQPVVFLVNKGFYCIVSYLSAHFQALRHTFVSVCANLRLFPIS